MKYFNMLYKISAYDKCIIKETVETQRAKYWDIWNQWANGKQNGQKDK